MKHTTQITAILIAMFIITQLIGLWVINAYEENKLPYGMEPPEDIEKQSTASGLASLMFAFALVILFFFFLTKIKAVILIRLWFFIVTILATALTLNAVLFKINFVYAAGGALIVALPLAYFKIFKRNILVHNITELMIYPGIGIVFVTLLFTLFKDSATLAITILLLALSFYDMWAVWQAKFMQKMAEYQITKLRFFTGFFVPYTGKKQRQKIKLIKQRYMGKSKRTLEKQFKKAKIKVQLAILGGGDIVFPIITAGIFYRAAGLIPALIITASATLALLTLFILTKKGRYYPAMPFLTIGMYLGMILVWILGLY